jgi:asparagine synthase (glutamine-hydrolysing)
MFAFALWDRNRGQLFLARDRLGKKPLYYSLLADGTLIFASELCGLLQHPRVPRRLSAAAVDDYFAFGYVPDPDSIYQGVHQVPAGHYLILERGGRIAPRCYWRPRFAEVPCNEIEAAEQLTERLRRAIDIRLAADVPLGAFLSGGVDSSMVVALMAGQRSDPIATFTIGFDGAADETAYAEAVARRYRTAHVAERIGVDYLDAAAEQAAVFGEPFADSSSVPTFMVSQLARRGVTVALSGDGGDELFGGYRRYRWHRIAEAVRGFVPATLRSEVFGQLAQIYPKLDRAPRWLRAKHFLTELSLDSALGYYRTVSRIQDAARRRLMSRDFRGAIDGHEPSARIARLIGDADTDDPLAQAQYVDMKTWLVGDILTKVDRASMAHSLEVRVPLLDHSLVEWAGSLPRALLLRGGEGKYVLKRAAEKLVPRANLYRRKQGFATPLADQFRGAGAARVRARLLGAAMLDSGFFDPNALTRLIDEHETGVFDHGTALWSLLVFEGFLSRDREDTGSLDRYDGARDRPASVAA